jgi:hypothetical protein
VTEANSPLTPKTQGYDPFESLGFSRTEWQVLADALKGLAIGGDVAAEVQSMYGRKYIVDGRIGVASGEPPLVRSIWIVDRGLDAPRLVTAYPRPQRGR